jgi:hypothetical protein
MKWSQYTLEAIEDQVSRPYDSAIPDMEAIFDLQTIDLNEIDDDHHVSCSAELNTSVAAISLHSITGVHPATCLYALTLMYVDLVDSHIPQLGHPASDTA